MFFYINWVDILLHKYVCLFNYPSQIWSIVQLRCNLAKFMLMVIIWLVSSFYVFSCIITFPYLKILLHKQVDALCHCVSVIQLFLCCTWVQWPVQTNTFCVEVIGQVQEYKSCILSYGVICPYCVIYRNVYYQPLWRQLISQLTTKTGSRNWSVSWRFWWGWWDWKSWRCSTSWDSYPS